jgi:glyoxylase-like metal-dependent hydrolase (beta-lactamase superfamily II)
MFVELRKLTDRIYYLPSEEENDRPVLSYIYGDTYSFVVDAGNSANHVKKFYNELKMANLRHPDFTVVTHWHWDHTFGMHAVKGKTIAGRLSNQKLKEVATWKWHDSDMKERLESGMDIEICDRCIKVEYTDRQAIKVVTADIEFDGRLRIDLGGITCELIETDTPHSRDSVLVYILEEKTLIVGDADCADSYENNGKYDKIKLKNYMDLIQQIDFSIYVLGHDEPETKEKAIAYLTEELSC